MMARIDDEEVKRKTKLAPYVESQLNYCKRIKTTDLENFVTLTDSIILTDILDYITGFVRVYLSKNEEATLQARKYFIFVSIYPSIGDFYLDQCLNFWQSSNTYTVPTFFRRALYVPIVK